MNLIVENQESQASRERQQPEEKDANRIIPRLLTHQLAETSQRNQLNPSFCRRLTSVLRAMPRARAASALLPFDAARARTRCSRS